MVRHHCRGAVATPSVNCVRVCGVESREVEMIATVRSATILGARGHPVSVEVHVGKGLPGFSMLGLPEREEI